MSSWEWVRTPEPEPKVLLYAALFAFFVEAIALTAIGWHEHWLAHPQKSNGLDPTKFIEAEMFQVPQEAHLVEEKRVAVPAPKPEATISKVPGKGKPAKEESKTEENQTDSGLKLAPTHGPVAVFAPPPVIPPYLQNQDLKTTAVIDFFVTAQGAVMPRLVGSTGNEELDAIALAAVRKWQFRPAENNHQTVDSKVRLRIVFEVK